MISTKTIIGGIEDVPREWIFEYYLNLKERLTGQDVKILSAFNSSDKVPSMFIYFDTVNAQYKFKDFSSGHQGDAIHLVTCLFNLGTFANTVNRIVTDYAAYVKDNNISVTVEHQFHDKYKVTDYEIRHWTNLDEAYWMSYKIGSKLLEHYNVSPLEFFTMEKTELDGSIKSVKFNRKYVYGYFRNDGSLYKIYMPKNPEKKFIKVENYTQGSDQLTSSSCDALIITSSLKDLMAFRKLGLVGYQSIAPDSENSMITKTGMHILKQRFKKVIVLFDNDEPGIAAAKKYQENYGVSYVVLDMEKDLSDSVKAHGLIKVKEKLLSLLNELDIQKR